MHVLFVHKNFPAQFGHVADYLVRKHGYRATFISQLPSGMIKGVERIQYVLRGGATERTHHCGRTFENGVWHAHAVYDALAARPDIRPDLIVGHSGFGSTLFLRELHDCPIVGYFEYFYRPRNSDMDFRPDFPPLPLDRLRAKARNAMLLLDLEDCTLGYSPTRWQRDRLPCEYREKVRVVFDGIDTDLWRPRTDAPRRLGTTDIPRDVRIVTYVARGMESLRGFDIFMKAARLICRRRSDVVFAVVGQDAICYGGDEKVTGSKSFRQWVLTQDDYDLSRFLFLGTVPPAELANILAISDLHVYLTAPFVLSWSLMNALACGVTVLASDTAPVREMIAHEQNGLLCDFFDVEGFAAAAGAVLDAPEDFRRLGAAGAQMIRKSYSLDACLPQMLDLYQQAANR